RERVQGRAVLPGSHHQQKRAATSRDELHHWELLQSQGATREGSDVFPQGSPTGPT
ncbi:unnamed protein product, partial [Ectocarpus sp. 13 AM-2016]